MAVRTMCFATLLDDSTCDFNDEKAIHPKGAQEEFEYNCVMKCEC